jgi:TusA-related sulfurtransferase
MLTPDAGASESRTHTLNLRGIPCPLNLVKAKLAIEKIAIGDILKVELDDGEPIRNVPVSLGRQGQEILATTKRDSHFCITVRRRL